jgi:hypothetical protein
MEPFVLSQHNRHYSTIRELRGDEYESVFGANWANNDTSKSETYTVTVNSDGGNDGTDAG